MRARFGCGLKILHAAIVTISTINFSQVKISQTFTLGYSYKQTISHSLSI